MYLFTVKMEVQQFLLWYVKIMCKVYFWLVMSLTTLVGYCET